MNVVTDGHSDRKKPRQPQAALVCLYFYASLPLQSCGENYEGKFS